MPITVGKPTWQATAARSYALSYELTREELRRAAAAREKFRFSWWVKVAVKIVAVPMTFICGCGLVILLRMEPAEFTQMFMAMYALFLFLGLVLIFHGQVFVAVNLLWGDLKKKVGENVTGTVDSNGVTSEALGTAETVPWKAFHRSGATKHGLILNLESGQFLWLPAKSFASAEDWQAVRDLAAKRLPRE